MISTSDTIVSSVATNSLVISSLRPNTELTNVMIYNTTNGEVGYNSTTPLKSFIIDHPIEKEKYLVHICLEGPEAGVYYRGTGKIINNNFTIVNLPGYVSALAKDFTVQITPIYDEDNIYSCSDVFDKQFRVTKVFNNQFRVYGRNGEFFWLVQGKRSDIEVEPLKTHVNVKGNGPYKWI